MPRNFLRAVIFDLGGVLVRTDDRAPRANLAARLGMNYAELSDLVFDNKSARQATLGQISTGQHWEAVRARLGLSQEIFSDVRKEFWAGDTLDTSLVNFLRSLRPRYQTALLSNAWDDLRAILERELKILDAFDQVIISAEVGLMKPDERIFHLALERLGVAPGEAVFVDDFSENIDGARAIGLHAIHFRSADQARVEVEQMLDSR
jgi:epoxide hydrolase-like predicted phosphatase